MVGAAPTVREAGRGDTLVIASPDVGEVRVLVPEPQRTAMVDTGVQQIVFTHPSGRKIGMNRPTEDGDYEVCRLVADDDGFQHALVVTGGETQLHTRREPGRPEDWESRGPVEDVEAVDAGDTTTG